MLLCLICGWVLFGCAVLGGLIGLFGCDLCWFGYVQDWLTCFGLVFYVGVFELRYCGFGWLWCFVYLLEWLVC